MQKKKHYVYVLLDPRREGDFRFGKYKFNFEPFYVGKGIGDRCNEHWNRFIRNIDNEENVHRKFNRLKDSRLKKIHEEGLVPIVVIKHSYFNEDLAYAKEVELIEKIGRVRYGGTLLNLAVGGRGGSRLGTKLTAEQKESMSKTISSVYESERGEEVKRKIGESRKRTNAIQMLDPRLRKKISKQNAQSATDSWKRIKDDPLRLAEVSFNISEARKLTNANASPLQKLKWGAQRRVGHMLRKVPIKKRDMVKAELRTLIERTRSDCKDRLYTRLDLKLSELIGIS